MKRLLIANRGEIALRITRTAHRMGIAVVAVYSDADAEAPHVRQADAAYHIGASPPAESYLNADAVFTAIRQSGADAVHPGYGFLAERPDFAQRCEAAGITFVGPPSTAMRALGNKASAKRLLEARGVPFLPGYHAKDQSDDVLAAAAEAIGMPVMIKAASGGGGRGMRLVRRLADFGSALRSARSEALSAFGDDEILLERALLAPRHVEVQVFGDVFGSVIHLGERDCSVQRRHQKLIEEAPSPAVDEPLRERLGAAAILVARAANYHGAGTVEFLLDSDGAFYFIELNARLQVEHAVTEAITGLDLVEWQLRIAMGEPLPLRQSTVEFRGHAIEARLCAEDPAHDFLPQTGTIRGWEPPRNVRVDHALEVGAGVSPFYDSMLAKLIAYGPTRDDARRQLAAGVAGCVVLGVKTNAAALAAFLCDDTFARGAATTGFIEERLAEFDFNEQVSSATIALAAALRYCSSAQSADFGSWTAWSSTELPPATVVLRVDRAQVHVVRIAARSAAITDVSVGDVLHHVAFAPFEPAALNSKRGAARYRLGHGPWLALSFAFTGSTLDVASNGQTHTFTDVTADRATSPSAAAGDGMLRAPMSGRIVGIHTQAGQRAAAGETVIVVEAMKMEQSIVMPIAAVVRSVTAITGTQVQTNDILLEYDPLTT